MVELIYKELTFAVIGAAMEVHRVLGLGFLEGVYQVALERELTLRGVLFEKQVRLPVTYKDILVGEYFADLVIDKKFIVSRSRKRSNDFSRSGKKRLKSPLRNTFVKY